MEPGQTTERRIVSVLFGDIVGFTPLGERLDPEDVATVQDAYFAAVREIVARYGGRVEKFIGDAAMAVFGLPRTRDDDAERAVRAGLALVAAVEQLGPRLGLEDAALRLRVGINTGEVVATMGTGVDDWRITGDTVNTSARFQTAAPPGGVLIGETTALSVADVAELTEAGPLELKGKAAPVRAWVVAGILPRRSREHAMGGMTAPMLGRDAELARLSSMIREAGTQPRRMLVVAPPGVGKSRLLDELAASDLGGALVLRAAVRPGVESPFAPVAILARTALRASGWDPDTASAAPDAEAIAALLARAGASQARAGVLARELSLLAGESAGPAAGRPETAPGDPRDRIRRFDDWISALDLLAGPRKAAWLLEDLHWSGPDLLAFVDRVQATPAPQGRVVIGTARPSLLEREPAWCGPREAEGITRLDLEPLPPADMDALVHALVGDALPASLVEQIAARSDGNPLFLEELLRTWVSVGMLVSEPDGTWRLEGEAGSIDLPATVQAIYAAQIDDLPPAARRLARHASVAGRAFPGNALEALEAGDHDAVERLRLRALIEGPDDAELGPSYLYRHALLRDAGYATLARAERARLHARLAAWMTEMAGARVDRVAESIARHYLAALEALPALAAPGASLDRGELTELTTAWLERAARAAIDAGAPAAARELVGAALDLTEPGAAADQARRLALRGEATAFSGDMDEGLAAYREAAGLFSELLVTEDDPQARAAARDGYAAAILAQGTLLIEQLMFAEAEALAESALGSIGPDDDLATARLRYLRAWAQVAYQPRPEAMEDLRFAIEICEREGDQAVRLDAMYLLQAVESEFGSIERPELLARIEEVGRIAESVGATRRAVSSYRAVGLNQAETAPGEGLPWVRRAMEMSDAHGLLEDTAWAWYGIAEIEFVRGDWDAAIGAALEALDMAEPQAYHRPVVRTLMVLTPMALARGRKDLMERAAAWIERRRATLPDSPFGRFMQSAMDLRLAEVGLLPALVPGDDLLDAWDEAPGLPSWQAATWTNVKAWIDAGALATADQAVQLIARWQQDADATPLGGAVHGALAARLALAHGDPSRAIAVAEWGIESARGLQAPWGVAIGERVRARALSAAGRAQEARQAEAAAATIERDLGIVRALD